MGTSYLKALQLQKKLEEKAKQEAENRTTAESLLEEIDQTLSDYKKADIDVRDAEEERKKAKSLMDAKEYGESLGVLAKTKEKLDEAKTAALDNMLSSSEDMIMLSQTLGAETKKAEELLAKTKKAIDEDSKLEKIIKLVREAWGEAEKILQERISGMFSAAQSLVNKTKEIGKDVKAGEALYQEARELVDKGEYREALDKLSDCVEIIGSKVKEHIELGFDEVKGIISLAEESDVDTSKVKEDMGEISNLLEEAEYEKALKAMALLKENSNKLVSDNLGHRVKNAEKNIETGKEIEAEVKKAEELLSEAKKALHSKDYRKLEDTLQALEEEVGNSCFQSVLKAISSSRGHFIQAKKIGADMSGPLDMLNKARDALKDGMYKEAIDYAKKSEADISAIISQYENAQSHMEEVEENLSVASELGIDTAFSEQLVDEARSALADNNFSKALELINKGKEKIENAEYEKVMDSLTDTEAFITLADKIGVDTKELNVLLDNATNALKNKKFREALETASNLKLEVNELMRSRLAEMIESARSQFRDESLGDVSEAVELLDQAEAALSEGVLEEAYKLSQKASEKLSGFQEEKVKQMLMTIEDGIKLLEEQGGDVSKLLPAFNRASSMMKESDFRNAAEAARECKAKLFEAEKETFEDIFSSSKLAAVEARRKGININGIKQLLEEAKKSYAQGDFRTAIERAVESKNLSETMKERYMGAYKSITEVAGLITEAKKDGVDIKPVAKVLMQAKLSLEAQDYEKALSITQACKESLQKIRNQYTAAKSIVYSQMLLTTASNIEIDVSKWKKELEEAKKLMKAKDFDKSLEIAESIVSELEKKIEGHLINIITKTETAIESARGIGIHVEEIEGMLKSSKERMKTEDFEGAYISANDANQKITQLSEISQKAVMSIQKAKSAISDALNVGADVMAAKIMMEQAVHDIKENKYQDAISKTEKIVEVVDKAQTKKVEDVLSSFEEALKGAKGRMDTAKSEKYLQDARKLLAEKKYKDALNMAMQSEGELEKMSLQHKMAEESLNAAKAKLDDMAKDGVPGGEAKIIMERAQKAFEDGDFVQVLSLAVEAGEKAHSIKEAHMDTKEMILQSINRIKTLKEQGVVVKSAEAIVAGAHAEFKNQEYAKARDYAHQAVEEAESKYHTFVGDKIEELKKEFPLVKERGGNVERAQSILADIDDAWKAKEYSKVFALIDKTQIVLNYEAKGAVRKRISMIEVALDEAKTKGVDISEAANLIHDAIIELEKGNFDIAVEMAEKAHSMVSNDEGEREEMEDALLAAESIMNKAKKFGLDMKNVKKMLDEAKVLKETDVEQALNLAETARDEASRIMGELTPRITPSLKTGKLYNGEWTTAELSLINTGRALGKDVKIKVLGVETKGVKNIENLRGGGSETISIQIKPHSEGEVKIKIFGECLSLMEKKNVPYEAEITVHVEERPKSSFKIVKAESMGKCSHCNGGIKQGMDIVLCGCGKTYHIPCAGRRDICSCGKSIKTDDKPYSPSPPKDGGNGGSAPQGASPAQPATAKKKLALKLG
ncbi:MAG: hypothetical protein QCI38_02045 [Candidatus Thermoplasmatota archaeon]|nr:hypothetical protein [Candidatus Thermoplasmatota archaeon]